MSFETLKDKVERLIEKAQNASGEVDAEKYNFYKNYIEGTLAGDIVIPDWFTPEGTLFANQKNVTSLDTGKVNSLMGEIGPRYEIHSLPALQRVCFRNVESMGTYVMYFGGAAWPIGVLGKLTTIEFGKIMISQNAAWCGSGGERGSVTTVIIPQGWKCSIYLHTFTNLTTECLHAMIENLADLTGTKSNTFSIGTGNVAKIDDEHIAMLNNKNWTYS